MIKVSHFRGRQRSIWPSSESGAMPVIKISAQHAMLSHIIPEKLVINRMPNLADSAVMSWSNLRQVWSQRSEMYAGNLIVLHSCRNQATNYLGVVIHAKDVLMRHFWCHVWSLNVLKRWNQVNDQMYAQMIFAQFVIQQQLVRNRVFNLTVVTYSIKNAYSRKSKEDGMVQELFSTTCNVPHVIKKLAAKWVLKLHKPWRKKRN